MLPSCRGIPASDSSASTYSVHNHLLHTGMLRRQYKLIEGFLKRTFVIIIIKPTLAVADVNVYLVGKRKI